MVNIRCFRKNSQYFIMIGLTIFCLYPIFLNAQVSKGINIHSSNRVYKIIDKSKMGKSPLIKIPESNEGELILEFTIPEFKVSKCSHNGTGFQIVNIPGYYQTSEAGKPQVPVKGYLLGIPPASKTVLEILDVDFTTLPDYNICPAGKFVIKQDIKKLLADENVSYEFFLDKAIYSRNSFYPDIIAKTGNTGLIRDQYVENLQIFPIQFNPVTHEIRWYKRIKIKVSFIPSNSKFNLPVGKISASEPFEKILSHSLLNYQAAKFWKRTSKPLRNFKSLNKLDNSQTPGKWYKIFVKDDGIYAIDRAELEQAGLNLSTIDPGKIRIFNRGNEIPIYIKGEGDGVFDETDYIEFYGVKTKTDYTYTNVYWLTVDETKNGLRMAEKNGHVNGSAPVLTRSKENVHFEQEKYYSTSIPQGEGEDHWFWDYIVAPDSLNFSAHLNSVADVTNNDCLFKVEYRGFTDVGLNPDHHTELFLNGHQLLDDKWDGRIKFNSQTLFPQNYLSNGANIVTINLPGDTGAEADVLYVNWFEIEYWRDYVAQNDSLIFWGEGNGKYQFEVKNFSDTSIELFDITASDNIKRIINFAVAPAETSNNLIFQDDLSNKQRYFALTENKRRVPQSIIADESSQLQSEQNQADYIIITHEDFYNSIVPLANFRQSQGLNVMTIKITDIYDEFNYGIKNPQAIKDFLDYAYHSWQKPAPSYVLLVGDASYDYKDHLKTGNKDYMPTHLFESTQYNTETSSDNYFVCVSGDDNLPDMLIGRLSVRTETEAEIIINKIIDYENSTPENSWNRNLLFIADNKDAKGDYGALSNYLIDNFIPSDYIANKAYLDDFVTSDSLKDEIIHRINQGCLITNYFGHGGIEFWAGEKIFESSDVVSLNNGIKLPFVVSLSCLNGFFQHAQIPYCLSEELLKADNGGAIACLAPSGFANASALQMLARGLYCSVFQDQDYLLGSIVVQGKIEIFKAGDAYLDHIDFYNLLGDPGLHLKTLVPLSTSPSIYYGDVTVDNNPAAIGGEISAWINNINYPVSFKIRTTGKYGPMYVNGDDPATYKIEGGVNGDTIRFRLAIANQDTLWLRPTAIWEAGVKHNLNLNVVTTSVPLATPISIDISVNDKIVGLEVMDYDPIPNNSVIKINISGGENGIDKKKIELSLNDQMLNEGQYSKIDQPNDPLHNKVLLYKTESLSDGDYEMMIKVSDLATPANTTENHFSFRICSSLKLERVFNFPNPMQNSTKFTYYLYNDEPADVNIKIYTVAGRLIKVIENIAADVGYNEIYWDGRDANNDEIANGVYFYKISARDGNKRTEVIARLAMMR